MMHGLDELLAGAERGNPAAWRGLIDACAGRVYALMYRRCGDGELAEEITQATFVKVVGKLGEYREQGKFEAWLFRIAINLLRDEMRRRKRQPANLGLSDGDATAAEGSARDLRPDEVAENQEQCDLLRAAVVRLGDADRQVIELRYVAELTFAQIAQALDEPLGTVLARGHRALKKLRQILDESAVERR